MGASREERLAELKIHPGERLADTLARMAEAIVELEQDAKQRFVHMMVAQGRALMEREARMADMEQRMNALLGTLEDLA